MFLILVLRKSSYCLSFSKGCTDWWRQSLFWILFRLRIGTGESQRFPVFFGHQIVVHATPQILFCLVAAQGIVVLIFSQAAHVFDHIALAQILMVQRKASLVWRCWYESFLAERNWRHNLWIPHEIKLSNDSISLRFESIQAIPWAGAIIPLYNAIGWNIYLVNAYNAKLCSTLTITALKSILALWQFAVPIYRRHMRNANDFSSHSRT